MKKKLIVLAMVAAIVLLSAIYLLRGPGTVPAGQQPLTTLSSANTSGFDGAFDADSGTVRLVLLLSPT